MRLGSLELPAGARLTVVSPHLDDAVLSVGATIARAVRQRVDVTVLTVLACDPDSPAPTRGWDARAGFATEGDAAQARRLEDDAACAALGATPIRLPFGSVDYERHGDELDVANAVRASLGAAHALLLPGAPLTHPDHAWLVRTLIAAGFPEHRIGVYLEQPYAVRGAAASGSGLLDDEPELERVRLSVRDWVAKRRAIRCYRSQLPLLALHGRARLERHLWSDARAGGEAVVWPPPGTLHARP